MACDARLDVGGGGQVEKRVPISKSERGMWTRDLLTHADVTRLFEFLSSIILPCTFLILR